eukprot:3451614-Pyramimonas_sp.AAC.1
MLSARVKQANASTTFCRPQICGCRLRSCPLSLLPLLPGHPRLQVVTGTASITLQFQNRRGCLPKG